MGFHIQPNAPSKRIEKNLVINRLKPLIPQNIYIVSPAKTFLQNSPARIKYGHVDVAHSTKCI